MAEALAEAKHGVGCLDDASSWSSEQSITQGAGSAQLLSIEPLAHHISEIQENEGESITHFTFVFDNSDAIEYVLNFQSIKQENDISNKLLINSHNFPRQGKDYYYVKVEFVFPNAEVQRMHEMVNLYKLMNINVIRSQEGNMILIGILGKIIVPISVFIFSFLPLIIKYFDFFALN